MTRMSRYRGATMALYSMFILFVAVPLLAATVDMSRYWVIRTELTDATDAACAAYANTLNLREYRESGAEIIRPDPVKARQNAMRFFGYGKPEGARLTSLQYRASRDYADTLVATCTSQVSMTPMVMLGFKTYDLKRTSTAQAKYGTAANWR